MLPGHRGDAGNVRHVLGGLLARQQLRQDGHIVENDAVGNQSATMSGYVIDFCQGVTVPVKRNDHVSVTYDRQKGYWIETSRVTREQ